MIEEQAAVMPGRQQQTQQVLDPVQSQSHTAAVAIGAVVPQAVAAGSSTHALLQAARIAANQLAVSPGGEAADPAYAAAFNTVSVGQHQWWQCRGSCSQCCQWGPAVFVHCS